MTDEARQQTCFVIMPIGDQRLPDQVVLAADLRKRYDRIAAALKRARGTLQVIRADDIAGPGVISKDVCEFLLHVRYVVADITYLNANVYYELGLRHATRPGTIIIRDRSSRQPPFDLAHCRYIEYENTSDGMADLTSNLAEYLEACDKAPEEPDNEFLWVARQQPPAPPDGRYKVLQIGPDGKPVWDWLRLH
jgi:hypothetical protein